MKFPHFNIKITYQRFLTAASNNFALLYVSQFQCTLQWKLFMRKYSDVGVKCLKTNVWTGKKYSQPTIKAWCRKGTKPSLKFNDVWKMEEKTKLFGKKKKKLSLN